MTTPSYIARLYGPCRRVRRRRAQRRLLFEVALEHADTVLIFVAYLTAIPLFVAGLSARRYARGWWRRSAGAVVLLFTRAFQLCRSSMRFIYAVPAVDPDPRSRCVIAPAATASSTGIPKAIY